jgi:hypothetical protein
LLKNPRLPTVQITSEIILVNRASSAYKLFLVDGRSGDRAQLPSEMLNGARTFIPVVDDAGGIAFLSIEGIVMLSVPASVEFAPQQPDSAAEPEETAELTIDLTDESQIFGSIRYQARAGMRIQDFLNSAGRFITLRQGDTALFVNKRHVARIAPLKRS